MSAMNQITEKKRKKHLLEVEKEKNNIVHFNSDIV